MPSSILFTSLGFGDRNWLLRHGTEAEYMPQLRSTFVVEVVNNSRVYPLLLPSFAKIMAATYEIRCGYQREQWPQVPNGRVLGNHAPSLCG